MSRVTRSANRENYMKRFVDAEAVLACFRGLGCGHATAHASDWQQLGLYAPRPRRDSRRRMEAAGLSRDRQTCAMAAN
jgi:hypothetical protein